MKTSRLIHGLRGKYPTSRIQKDKIDSLENAFARKDEDALQLHRASTNPLESELAEKLLEELRKQQDPCQMKNCNQAATETCEECEQRFCRSHIKERTLHLDPEVREFILARQRATNETNHA